MNKFTKSTLSVVLAFGTMLPLYSQEGDQSKATQQDPRDRKLKVRLVALGHRRDAKFVASKEPKVIKIKTPDGETITETIPAGVPIEVMGKEFEYLPPLVYFPERKMSSSAKDNIATSPLILNACTQAKELSYRQRLDILLRRPVPGADNEMELQKYVSTNIGEEQSDVLVAIINRPGEKEGWKNPISRSFDTSPTKLPGGSLLIFNGTPYNMEVDIPLDGAFKTVTIKSLASQQFKPGTNSKGRTMVKARLVASNGQKKQFFYNTLRVDDKHRSYLFAYFDPRQKASNPAGMVQFHDEYVMPETPAEAQASATNN